MQEYFQRPVIIMFQNDDGTYSGSCRAPDTIEAFTDFRQQCEESKLTIYSAGHSSAFGISTTATNSIALQDYFNEKYADIDVTPTYNCDFIFNSYDTDVCDIISEITQYESLWGQGIKEPLIAIKDVLVGPGTLSLVGQQRGKPTLRIVVKETGVVCIRFKSSQEEFDSLLLPYDGKEQYYRVTIVGRAEMNEWNGKFTSQLIIEDYEINGVGYDF